MIANDYISLDLLIVKLKEAYSETLVRRWLIQGEERYTKLMTKKVRVPKFNANKALKSFTEDDIIKLKESIKKL